MEITSAWKGWSVPTPAGKGALNMKTERDTYVKDIGKGCTEIMKDIESLQALDSDKLEENENYRDRKSVV